MISIHDFAAVDAWRRRQKLEPRYVKALRRAYYRAQTTAGQALEALPKELRELFAAEVATSALELASRHDSQLDGASKLLFRTAAGLLIESVVLRVATGRTALCVSTQVGCAARCAFCATGQMSIVRNLTRDEVLDQLTQANRLLKAEERRVRNVVFMGMGEPLHNEAELHAAIEVLTAREAFNLHPGRLLVSTVGVPEGMLRLVERHPQVRLAVSLHSARQEVRERLMPIAARHSLAELRRAIEVVADRQERPVMIEYLLLDDWTDTPEDVSALTDYLRGLDVHVNLIPFNAIEGAAELRPSTPERQAEFSAALKQAGFRVTTRYSLGADVTAACGQLVREQPAVRTAARRAAGGSRLHTTNEG